MDQLKVRDYTHNQIELRAAAILAQTFPGGLSIPIEIDFLVQRHESVDHIIPSLHLEEKFDVAAVLVRKPGGRFDILVDEDSYNYQPFRANFSIAHECGHIILHPRICQKCQNLDEALRIHMALRYDYKFVERAANRFASAVLMPASTLSRDVSHLYQGLAPQNNFDEDAVFHKLRSFLANKYCVTMKPMEIRLKELRLEQRIRTALKNQSPYL